MISVVIPTLNEAAHLGACLARLAEEPGPCEIVVADGGSSDTTRSVASAFPRARTLTAPRGRAAQMNAGARSAQGELLFFLHADSIPPAGCLSRIEACLSRQQVCAGSFCLRFDSQNPWLKLYGALSRINHALFTYGDQGLFLRRRTFLASGGFAEMPIMEDLEIQRRLRKMGRFVKIRDAVITSCRRYRTNGPVRQQLLNTALVLRYLLGASPQRLARRYRQGPVPLPGRGNTASRKHR